MGPTRRADQRLRDHPMPPLVPIDGLQMETGGALVMCAGFEERTTASLADVLDTNIRDLVVILLTYQPHIPENRVAEILEMCERSGIPVREVEYARDDRSEIGMKVLDKLKDVTGTVVIDISSMSRLLIVQLIAAVIESTRGARGTEVYYAEAMEYPPRQEDVGKFLEEGAKELRRAAMFISSQVYDISIVPELSSVALQGQPIRCVFFPSFNTYQLAAVSAELQPTWYSIINGVPPSPKNSWRRDAIWRMNRIEMLLEREEHDTSTLDYRETLETLIDIYQKHGHMEKLIVSPTGSKMQSVAVGVYRAFLKDIQIAYPTPLKYASPKEVTVGIGQKHRLVLDSFAQLRESLGGLPERQEVKGSEG